jgi:hypothetical protein
MFWQRTADLADDTWFSLRELLEYRKRTPSLADLAGYTTLAANLAEGEPERLRAAMVTPNFFPTLGVNAALGRLFNRDSGDDLADRVVLGHGLWQRRFGGAADIVGRGIQVSGRTFVVAGVLPAISGCPSTIATRAQSRSSSC